MSPERSSITMKHTPFKDILIYQSGDQWALHPLFQEHLYQEQAKQKERDMCAHDLPHSMRATQNGLTLLTILTESPQTAHLARSMTETDIAFVLYAHDVGYGSTNVTVVEREAEGHELASWGFVQQQAKNLPFLHPSRRYVAANQSLLRAGILGTANDHRKIIQAANEHPSSQNLFVLLIAAADKADYFVRQRVAHLPTPTDMTNPYHPLAHAVDHYQLRFDPTKQTLTYTVSLNSDNLFQSNFSDWHEYAQKYYPQVFTLLEAAAQLAGYRFEVKGENN